VKAVRFDEYGDIDVLKVVDVPTPVPGPGQVLVRVTNSGVCGTDLKIFTGAIPVNYPLIMGHEMTGEVIDEDESEEEAEERDVKAAPGIHDAAALRLCSASAHTRRAARTKSGRSASKILAETVNILFTPPVEALMALPT
jgi:threonine dehydrogenase-like Zn-dependent dehydrogenase